LEIWLAIDGVPTSVFYFEDQLRFDAKTVINDLNRDGLELHLLTGDRGIVAKSIAGQLGIENVRAEVSPIDKNAYVEALKNADKNVLMVGDGLNDAPALARANVSMSPSSAIDITQNTADIVYQGDLLTPVWSTIQTARKSTRLVMQNFMLAAIYNLIAIPAAVMGFVTPLIAAIAMSGSSLVVIMNAFRLRIREKK
jgi:Cu2+-exporting ATPase